MSYSVTIVDYRTSNLLSIGKAFQKVGAEVELTQDPERILRASRLVLPGVGAFGAAMRNIESLGIKEAIIRHAGSGKPLIGICLGMQLLFNVSFEHGIHEGLGLVDGDVVAFSTTVKVPHIGWNQVRIVRDSGLLTGVRDNEFAYFVHSYFVKTALENVVGTTGYGSEFPAIIERENVAGLQFHPEKSQAFGLKILENFLTAGSVRSRRSAGGIG